MDKFAGLAGGLLELAASREYREALGLPERVTEEYRLLGQGEYNRNYVFVHPVTGKWLVLRENFGSQMHLADQIGYEFQALKLLEGTGRTPRPLFVDGSRTKAENGVLVMEYLPGHAMDYRTELSCGAGCLADIHSEGLPEDHGLIAPKEPLKAILEECEQMAGVYMESPLGDPETKRAVRRLLDQGWKRAETLPEPPVRCCINTELNSTNFLAGEGSAAGNGEKKSCFLVDWEKPLYGDPAQDLGHFLAPTTTFWKTDVILMKEEMEAFLQKYIEQVDGRFDTGGLRERTFAYIPVTCLRGIAWCAMAWVEYRRPGRELVNPSTAKKLETYLDGGFLEQIRRVVETGG